MTRSTSPTLNPAHDVTWLARFWLASAAALAAIATLALLLGVMTEMAALIAGAIALAGFGVVLVYLRLNVRTGRELRYMAFSSIGQFVIMVLLLPLVPALAAAIVPAALIPLFVATPHLRRSELSRFSIGVWAFSALYATAAMVLITYRGVSPEAFATLAVQAIAAVTVVTFILVLLRRYFEAHGDAQHLALHDSLTGLANRTLFMDRVQQALHRSRRRESLCAVLFLDLDAFKDINDRHGHGYGDDLLRGVGERIASTTRVSETTARVGGDEFAVLAEDIDDTDQAMAIAQRIKRALVSPVDTREGSIPVRASMGVAVSTDGTESADDLVRYADSAMYESKREGRGEPVVARPAMRSASDRRASIKLSLRDAIDRGELRIEFQPMVDLRSGDAGPETGRGRLGSIVGFEALLRWEDPDRGLQAPGQFVKLAEETGDIVPIGRWVLQESLQQLATWRRQVRSSSIHVSVNLSLRQLHEPGFEDDVLGTLAGAGLEPDALVVEVSEQALLANTAEAQEVMQRLRARGVRLAIDNLGSGYASLGWVRSFAVDIIKLDGSLVEDAVGNARDSALLRTAVELGGALQVMTVGKGVETADQLRLLRSYGCDVAQGFLLARPAGPAAASELLTATEAPWSGLLSARQATAVVAGDPRRPDDVLPRPQMGITTC